MALQTTKQSQTSTPSQQAAAAIRRYALRLNETNVSECCGHTEALLRGMVRSRRLLPNTVFVQDLRKMEYSRNRNYEWKKTQLMKREDHAEVLNTTHSIKQSPTANILKALARVGALGKTIAVAAENKGAIAGGGAKYWTDVTRSIFEALAKSIENQEGTK